MIYIGVLNVLHSTPSKRRLYTALESPRVAAAVRQTDVPSEMTCNATSMSRDKAYNSSDRETGKQISHNSLEFTG